jgi:heme-degrading monooxygenase HmoA
MIVRTWSATATSAGAESYSRYFAGTLLPQLRMLPGFEGAYLLRRDLSAADKKGEHDTVELTTHTFWESLEAIRAFAGDDVARSVVEPEAQAMLASFDPTAAHRTVVVDARG